jgi:hypothetical protein
MHDTMFGPDARDAFDRYQEEKDRVRRMGLAHP